MATQKKLSVAITEYLQYQQARRQGDHHRGNNTAAADNNVLSMFLRMSGDKYLHNITPEHVSDWFYGPGGMRDRHRIDSKRGGRDGWSPPIGPATHNHYRSRLKMFFGWCIQRGYMKRDVMVLTSPLKVPKTLRNRPDPVTLLRLLEVASCDRDRAYLAVAVNTGLRSSEIRAMKVGDLDLDSGYMDVNIMKTGDVDEQPVTQELDIELRRWLLAYADVLGRPLQSSDYLFPRRRGGAITHYYVDESGDKVPHRSAYVYLPNEPIRETHLIVQKALRALGLPTQKEGTHTLRRAVARAYFDSVAQDKGDVAALRETAAFLHHSSTATTEIYLGLTPEKNSRNRRLRGKPFLSAMVSQENVVPLRAVGDAE